MNSLQRLAIPGVIAIVAGVIAAFFFTRKPPASDPDPIEPGPSASVTAPLELDAGPEPDSGIDAGVDAGKPAGKPISPGALMACCKALEQNSASAPPPQNMHLLAAARYCSAVAAQSAGQTSESVMAQLQKMIRSAPLPATCN